MLRSTVTILNSSSGRSGGADGRTTTDVRDGHDDGLADCLIKAVGDGFQGNVAGGGTVGNSRRRHPVKVRTVRGRAAVGQGNLHFSVDRRTGVDGKPGRGPLGHAVLVGNDGDLRIGVATVDRHIHRRRVVDGAIQRVGKAINRAQSKAQGIKGTIGVIGKRAVLLNGNGCTGRQGYHSTHCRVGRACQIGNLRRQRLGAGTENCLEVVLALRFIKQGAGVNTHQCDVPLEAVICLVEIRNVDGAVTTKARGGCRVTTGGALRAGDSLIVRAGPVNQVAGVTVGDVDHLGTVRQGVVDVEGDRVGQQVNGAEHMHECSPGSRVCRQRGDCLCHEGILADGEHHLVVHEDNRGANTVAATAPQWLVVLLVSRPEHQLDAGIGPGNIHRAVNAGCLGITDDRTTAAIKGVNGADSRRCPLGKVEQGTGTRRIHGQGTAVGGGVVPGLVGVTQSIGIEVKQGSKGRNSKFPAENGVIAECFNIDDAVGCHRLHVPACAGGANNGDSNASRDGNIPVTHLITEALRGTGPVEQTGQLKRSGRIITEAAIRGNAHRRPAGTGKGSQISLIKAGNTQHVIGIDITVIGQKVQGNAAALAAGGTLTGNHRRVIDAA